MTSHTAGLVTGQVTINGGLELTVRGYVLVIDRVNLLDLLEVVRPFFGWPTHCIDQQNSTYYLEQTPGGGLTLHQNYALNATALLRVDRWDVRDLLEVVRTLLTSPTSDVTSPGNHDQLSQ